VGSDGEWRFLGGSLAMNDRRLMFGDESSHYYDTPYEMKL